MHSFLFHPNSKETTLAIHTDGGTYTRLYATGILNSNDMYGIPLKKGYIEVTNHYQLPIRLEEVRSAFISLFGSSEVINLGNVDLRVTLTEIADPTGAIKTVVIFSGYTLASIMKMIKDAIYDYTLYHSNALDWVTRYYVIVIDRTLRSNEAVKIIDLTTSNKTDRQEMMEILELDQNNHSISNVIQFDDNDEIKARSIADWHKRMAIESLKVIS